MTSRRTPGLVPVFAFVAAVLLIVPACGCHGDAVSDGDDISADELPRIDDDGGSYDDSAADDASDDDTTDDDTSIPDEDLTDYAPAPTNDAGIFVAIEGDDANPGTREAPMRTVQAGADAALAAGKAVFIAQGDYNESVTAHISLYGGYRYPEWHRDIDGNTTTIHATDDYGLKMDSEDPTAILVVEGLTIIAGDSSEVEEGYSVGVYVLRNYRTIFFRDHIVSGSDTVVGVGIFANTVALIRSRIESTDTALWTDDFSNGAVVGSILVVKPAEPRYYYDTSAAWFGDEGFDLIIGSYLYGGNSAEPDSHSAGVGQGKKFGSSIRIYNSIIDGGAAETSVALDEIKYYSPITKNDFWGASQDFITCMDIQFAYTLCTDSILFLDLLPKWSRNISSDPLFADADNGDYHLTPQSPCVDAGFLPWELDQLLDDFDWADLRSHIAEDFDGNPRPYGDGWDIGPYEWRP